MSCAGDFRIAGPGGCRPGRLILKYRLMSLLEVRDLSVTFGGWRGAPPVAGGQARLVHARPRRDAGAGRRERLGQVGDGAVDPAAAALPGRLAHAGKQHPLRRRGDGRGAAGAAAAGARQPDRDDLPGADDLAEPAAHARQADRRGAADPQAHVGRGGARAHARTAAPGRHSRRREPARRLSAPAFGRAAAARDDRDGDRQRARHPDRRRADDRARRDDPGADPRSDARAAGPARHGAAADHARSRDRAPHGRAGLRHDAGRDRRGRPDRRGVRRGRSTPIRAACSRPSRKAGCRPPTRPRRSSCRASEVKVWFPIRRGLFRRVKGYVKAVDGVSLAVRAGATLGVVGESGSGKTTLGLALLRLLDARGRHPLRRARHRASSREKRLRPLRREMQVVFQDPYSSLSPRLSIAQIVGEGLRVHRLAGRRGRAAAADRDDAGRSRARSRPRPTATRTNSPAASASASRSPARWC